jgi:hypothetical protein
LKRAQERITRRKPIARTWTRELGWVLGVEGLFWLWGGMVRLVRL